MSVFPYPPLTIDRPVLLDTGNTAERGRVGCTKLGKPAKGTTDFRSDFMTWPNLRIGTSVSFVGAIAYKSSLPR